MRPSPSRRDVLAMAAACVALSAMPLPALAKKPKKRKVVRPIEALAAGAAAARKKIKKAVTDPEQRQALIDLYKQYEKLLVDTANARDQDFRDLRRVSDQATSIEEYNAVLAQHGKTVDTFYAGMTDLALRLREHLTAEEWAEIYGGAR